MYGGPLTADRDIHTHPVACSVRVEAIQNSNVYQLLSSELRVSGAPWGGADEILEVVRGMLVDVKVVCQVFAVFLGERVRKLNQPNLSGVPLQFVNDIATTTHSGVVTILANVDHLVQERVIPLIVPDSSSCRPGHGRKAVLDGYKSVPLSFTQDNFACILHRRNGIQDRFIMSRHTPDLATVRSWV